jgi:hypothetical protein
MMKTITLTVFQDSGHAWVRFPLKRLEKMGIMNKISAYSYQRTTWAYLEEDCDAGVLVEALKADGYTIKDIKVYHTDRRSKIRGYSSFWNGYTDDPVALAS